MSKDLMNTKVKEETLETIKHFADYFLRKEGWESEFIYNRKNATIEIRLMDTKYIRGEQDGKRTTRRKTEIT